MSEGGKVGRPSKLTEEAQAKVCEALKGGNFRIVAARFAGVSPRTLRDWMAEGKKNPDSPEGDFRRAVIEAEGEAETKMVKLIMVAAESDPKHGEWWLSHRHAARWAEKKNVKLSGHIEDRPLDKLPRERLLQLLDNLGTDDP